LLEAGPEEEVRVPAVALRPQDEEIRLGVPQGRRASGPGRKAIGDRLFGQRRGQARGAEGGVALPDLQLAVDVGVRRVADVGDEAVRLPGTGLAGAAGRDADAPVWPGALDDVDHGLVVELDVAVGPGGERVGADGEAVALPQWVACDAADRLRARAAGQP